MEKQPITYHTATEVQRALAAVAEPQRIADYQRFFKTGAGEYGEGDVFIGVRVPNIRRVCRNGLPLSLAQLSKLMRSRVHEHRHAALIIATLQYAKADSAGKRAIYKWYVKNMVHIDNWDHVDVSAHKIVGEHLVARSRAPLYALARSRNMWKRRIAMVATAAFIARDDFDDVEGIAEALLHDQHDLLHKAVGWMLREMGKRDRKRLESFLKKHYRQMPRTMLRYAIERLPVKRRKQYLHGTIK